MRTKSKLVLAALAAIALLAVAVGGASARNFSVSERNFELIWNRALGAPKTLLKFFEARALKVECNVTLLGSYSANTIAKTTTTNQGTINHGELEGCVGGTATIRTETMPWGLRYRSFTGTLPNITGISTGMIGASFRIQESGSLRLRCTSTTEELEPGVGIIEGTGLENIRADETRTIVLRGPLCEFGSPGNFAGTGLIRNLPRTANITVTLI